MSVRQLAALARRHVFGVFLILLATAGIAIDFRYTQSGYQETAIVALEPKSFVSVEPLNVDKNFLLNNSLINTCQLLAIRLSGPQGESQLRRAGVSGDFAASVVNDSNADDPSYRYPDLSVSVTDSSPGMTHHEMIEVMQLISVDVADFQSGKQISTRDRLMTYTLSDSGPISQRGSSIRTYAALIFLALVATFLMCRFLDIRRRAAVNPNVG